MKKAILTISAILICGCAENTKKPLGSSAPVNIDINSELTSTPVFSGFEYVQLETSDSCLMEGVQKVISANDNFYILTSIGGNVMIFDKNGKFRTKLSKGKGPNEIIYPTDIALNGTDNTLHVLDTYRNVKIFDSEGQSTGTTKTFEEPSLALETAGKDYLFFEPNLSSKSDFHLRYCFKNGKSTALMPKTIGGGPFQQPNFFTKINEDSLYICHIFTDTIYQADVHDGGLIPRFIVNSGKKSANRKEISDAMADYTNYGNYLKEHGLLSGPRDLSFLHDKIFFSLNGEKFCFVTYDISTRKTELHTDLFDGLPNIYNSCGRTDDYVIYAMDMPWLLDYFGENEPATEKTKRMKACCTNENDNPVLILGIL